MSRKLYVGNLPFTVNEDQLKNLFTQFGSVESVKIVKDAFDGRSKGFAFVEMSTDEEANAASEGLNGTDFEGRSIRVDLARPKEARPSGGRGGHGGPRGGDRGGSRGGYRQGGSGGSMGERRSRW